MVMKSTKKPAMGVAIRIRPMDRWEVEDAARTIARAEEHKRDPKLMAKVREHVTSLHKAIGGKSIGGKTRRV